MDIKNRIEAAKTKLRRAEQAKTVAETQKKQAEEQVEEVRAEMSNEGVTPENITQEISKLEQQVEGDLTKVEELIPTV